VLRGLGLHRRMDEQGHAHDGMKIVWAGRESFFIDCFKHLGKRFMAYGQTQIQEDLFAAADQRGATVLTDVQDVQLLGLQGEQPTVRFQHHGETVQLSCQHAQAGV
jgi:p-hydroxybenzoate 3-monooxygenase